MERGWNSRAKVAARVVGWAGLLALIAVAATAQTQKKAAPPAKVAAASDEVPVKAIGSKSAPITMEVFSDYQCPSCKMLYEQTLKPLINEYVATGKVYLIHRDFPLPMHKYSTDAARWVNAGARLGRYPEVEAALYDNQEAWSADGNIQKFVAAALSPADFKRAEKMVETCVAESTGIKPASATSSPQGGHECSIDAAIAKDKALGNTVPITQTPTYRFYYKGQPYPPTPGYVSWPILKQFFDSLLAQ
ncbi:MAG: thioredoxin domain-containing protein [Candidatus Acidiferrales bacterium]